jgi:hypothetical protein
MHIPDGNIYGHRAIIRCRQQKRRVEFEVTLTLKPIRNCDPFVNDTAATVVTKSPDDLRHPLSIVLGSPWYADVCLERAAAGEQVECWLLPQRRKDILNRLRPSSDERAA